jgi:hypothetical protein
MAITLQLNASLVSALFGGGSGGVATADPATALLNFRRASAPGAEAKGLEQERKDPITLRSLDRFREAVAKATDLDKALSDPRILGVLLPALGLAGQEAFPGLVKRALLADPKEEDGLLANLGATFRSANETLNLPERGLAGLQDPKTVDALVNGFLTYSYRSGLDEKTAGIADALYFAEKASSVSGVFNLLGDAVMRRVVTGALGLPPQLAIQSVEAQGRAVTSRLDLEKLQDPKEVQKLISRYLIARAGEGGGLGTAGFSPGRVALSLLA